MVKIETPDGILLIEEDGSKVIWRGFNTPESLDRLESFGQTILRDAVASRFVDRFPELCEVD